MQICAGWRLFPPIENLFTCFHVDCALGQQVFDQFALIITSSRHTQALYQSETDLGCEVRAQAQIFHAILKIKMQESTQVIPEYVILFTKYHKTCWY